MKVGRNQVPFPPYLCCLVGGTGWLVDQPGSPYTSPRDVISQLHPEVAPQVLHFMQVPLRTSV